MIEKEEQKMGKRGFQQKGFPNPLLIRKKPTPPGPDDKTIKNRLRSLFASFFFTSLLYFPYFLYFLLSPSLSSFVRAYSTRPDDKTIKSPLSTLFLISLYFPSTLLDFSFLSPYLFSPSLPPIPMIRPPKTA
jgi:hypothetical protein